MRYQSQDARLRRVMMMRVLMLIGLILVLLMGRGVFKVYQLEREAYERRESAEARLESLKERETLLEENIAALETSTGVEAALRSQFDVGREGEGLIVVVEEAVQQEPPAPRTWWERLWGFVSDDES